MVYDLRHSNGILVMSVTNKIAQDIINKTPGQFRPWKRNSAVTVFEIQQDMTTESQGVKFYIWAGSLLIPRT